MICRFGWSIGSGLFHFELILLKIPLADGVTPPAAFLFLQAACIALRVIGFRVACYRWRARAGECRSLADCYHDVSVTKKLHRTTSKRLRVIWSALSPIFQRTVSRSRERGSES
jgi:hypothetical protein